MNARKGYVHLYFGQGKGKTTAAMGLAVRSLGRGWKVAIVQFLKSGTSGELEPLRHLGAEVFSGKGCGKFVSQMSRAERAQAALLHAEHLRQAVETRPDLLILDEVCAAVQADLLEEELLLQIIRERPEEQELVMTGRYPTERMREAADYLTEMKAWRHPYTEGVMAREGVEY